VSGIIWHIITFGAIGFFLAVTVYRTLKIARMPVHLKKELVQTPYDKNTSRYGGSYPYGFKRRHKPARRSRITSIINTVSDILLLTGALEHNKGLWPFTLSLHYGIYLAVAALFLNILNAIFVIAELPMPAVYFLQGLGSVFALAGYLLGSLGTLGSIIKHYFDIRLKPFNTASTYFNLFFLGAFFISGAYAWFTLPDFTASVSLFLKNLITLNTRIAVTFILSLHLVISLLFLIYLPLTNMIHFITKYFMYDEIQ